MSQWGNPVNIYVAYTSCQLSVVMKKKMLLIYLRGLDNPPTKESSKVIVLWRELAEHKYGIETAKGSVDIP